MKLTHTTAGRAVSTRLINSKDKLSHTPTKEDTKEFLKTVSPLTISGLNLLPESIVHAPIDLSTNHIRIYTDDMKHQYVHVPGLSSKTVGELLVFVLENEESCPFPLRGHSPSTVTVFEKKGRVTNQLDLNEKITDIYEKWMKSTESVGILMSTQDKVQSKQYIVTQLGSVVGKTIQKFGHDLMKRAQGRQSGVNAETKDGSSAIEREIKELADSMPFGDSYNYEEHVDKLFKTKNEEIICALLEDHLTKKEKEAEQNLQRSVHKDYKKFMETSTQIENLESDVLDLRNHLTEINSILKGLNSVSLNLNKSQLTIRDRAKLVGNLNNFIHWFLELPDELDILTSERLFDDAIKNIHLARERVRDNPQLAIAEASIKQKLNQRIRNLSDILLKDLQNPAIKKSESQQIINHLQSLDFASKAREVFLRTRSEKLKNDLSNHLTFDGNVKVYVNELSRIVFSAIHSTCDDFKHSFEQRSMMSGFVVWTMKVLRQYRSRFTRHVFDFGDKEDFEMMGVCFEISKTHCLELEAKGLSINFYLKQSFHNDLLKAIEDFQKRLETSINGQLSEEKWECKPIVDKQSKKMTESGIYVYNVVQKFSAVIPLINPESVGVVVSTFSLILEKYLFELSTYVDNMRGTNKHYLGIVANAQHLSEDLLTSVILRQENNNLETGIDELKSLQARLHALYVDIKDSYCNFQANDIVNNPHRLDWGNTKYNMSVIDETNLAPSQKLIKLFEYLHGVATDVSKILGKEAVHPITTVILDKVLIGLTQGSFWKDEKNTKNTCMFGEGGITQFILDMKYTLEASGPFLTSTSRAAITQAIERALIHYCMATETSPKKVLMDESWYKKTIKATLESSKTLKNVRP